MKKLAIVLMFICPLFSWADAWDNLTKEQALKVQEYLKINPYIIDYCDCCSFKGEFATEVYLSEVTSTEIIACDWDPTYYSIRAKVEILAKIPYQATGLMISAPEILESSNEITITMNYTWGYNDEYQKAAPLYTTIPYAIYGEQNKASGSCRPLVDFPAPKKIKNRAYKKWYKRSK